MSCPDWHAATAWRRGDGPAPPEWAAHLEHLASCTACRCRVAELDPTVLLAAAAAPAPVADETEARAIGAAVRSLIGASRLEARSRPDRQALIAAAVVMLALAAPLGLGRQSPPVAGPPVPQPLPLAVLEPEAEPLIEEVQPAEARVYQFGSEELPVVLIVDDNLDL